MVKIAKEGCAEGEVLLFDRENAILLLKFVNLTGRPARPFRLPPLRFEKAGTWSHRERRPGHLQGLRREVRRPAGRRRARSALRFVSHGKCKASGLRNTGAFTILFNRQIICNITFFCCLIGKRKQERERFYTVPFPVCRADIHEAQNVYATIPFFLCLMQP